MDYQRSPLLTWAYYFQGKSIDELRQSFLLTTFELESVRARAQEELITRDDELNHLRNLLALAMRERDEAQEKCQKLEFEKFLLQQEQQQLTQFPPIQSNQTDPLSGTSTIEYEPVKELDSNNNNSNDFTSPESEEGAFTSPELVASPQLEEELGPWVGDKPLPEQGKLLQAVMKAGPLLQTLLLAGPLPQWRHPPPPINYYQIPTPPIIVPPVIFENCDGINRKRTTCEASDVCPTEAKYQRVLLQ